jgi:hypothetical protein
LSDFRAMVIRLTPKTTTSRACPQIRRPIICARARPVASSVNAPARTE